MNQPPNELPKARQLNVEELRAFEEHQRTMAHNVGVKAVEEEIFPAEPGTDTAVMTMIYVNGHGITVTTDKATIRRILDILTGLEP